MTLSSENNYTSKTYRLLTDQLRTKELSDSQFLLISNTLMHYNEKSK